MKLADTDLLVAYVRGQAPAVQFITAHQGKIGTTTINAAELYEGALGARNPDEERAKVDLLLASIPVVPFGPLHAKAYAAVARNRKKRSLPGGPFDLLVAVIAIGEGASVVTRNKKDFEGHDGLIVEPW